MQDLTGRFKRELRLRDYSPSTIKQYSRYLSKYFNFCLINKNLDREEKILSFLDLYSEKPGAARLAGSAVKFFYRNIISYDCPYFHVKKKNRKRIPVVLSRKEILFILETIKNRKHRTMIGMLYGSGLRVSEVANLRVGDVRFDMERVFVRNSKGKKDRYTLLSKFITKELLLITKDRASMSIFLKL